MEKFENTIAIVTGASAGIGNAICRRLLAESTTLTVVGLSRRVTEIDHKQFHSFICDVSDPAQIETTIETVRKTFPNRKISILVNNAGHAKPLPLLDDKELRDDGTLTPDSLTEAAHYFQSMLNTNVLGLTLVTRQVSKFMDHSVCGNIININSMSGHRVVPSVNTHFYTATKHAVTALTEGTRQELRRMKSKVRANQISPGFVDTDFFGAMSQDPAYLEKMKGITATALTAQDVSDSVLLCIKAVETCQIGDIQMRPTGQAS